MISSALSVLILHFTLYYSSTICEFVCLLELCKQTCLIQVNHSRDPRLLLVWPIFHASFDIVVRPLYVQFAKWKRNWTFSDHLLLLFHNEFLRNFLLSFSWIDSNNLGWQIFDEIFNRFLGFLIQQHRSMRSRARWAGCFAATYWTNTDASGHCIQLMLFRYYRGDWWPWLAPLIRSWCSHNYW